MNFEIPELINAAITFFGGIYVALLGFRIVGKKPGVSPKYDRWYDRFGGFMKVGGPLLVVFGLFLAFQAIAWVNWIRYRTADGVCSAEFPKSPKTETITDSGVESTRMALAVPGRDAAFVLSFSDVPKQADLATPDEILDSFRLSIPLSAAVKGKEFKFLKEKKITVNGLPGRYLEFAVGQTHIFRIKIVIVGGRVYKLIAVTTISEAEDDMTKRFLDSMQVHMRP